MQRRIGAPPPGVRYPVWAWYQYQDERARRPDLRRSAHAPSGTPLVLIEFELPDDQVLLSDFELWHYVLNDWYVAARVWRDRTYPPDVRERSWRRIFDLDRIIVDLAGPRSGRSIQATVWQVPMSVVRRVRPFVAR